MRDALYIIGKPCSFTSLERADQSCTWNSPVLDEDEFGGHFRKATRVGKKAENSRGCDGDRAEKLQGFRPNAFVKPL